MSVDKENFAGVLENFPQQVREAASLGKDITCSEFKNIVICGMGGSGLPGEIVKSAVHTTPITLVKNYKLPEFVNGNSLVFAVSYSGNTEETLALYDQAKEKKAQIIAIASGNRLAEKAQSDGMKMVKVPTPTASGPSGFQPRMAFGYQTIPILNILENHNIISNIDWERAAAFLESEKEAIKEKAKEYAKNIKNKIPLIYASEGFHIAAYKWKINCNENAKMHAFSNYFPEFNHHEINAFAKLNGDYIVFILKDKDDHPRIKKRMYIVERLIKDRGVEVVSVESKGDNFISRLFWTIYVGDWLSYYAAVDRNIDPTPIEIVENFKRMLND